MTLLAKVCVAMTKVLAKSTMVTGGGPTAGPVVAIVMRPVPVVGIVVGPPPVIGPAPVVTGGRPIPVVGVNGDGSAVEIAAVWKWWYHTGVYQMV
jgi:hypothetical protein